MFDRKKETMTKNILTRKECKNELIKLYSLYVHDSISLNVTTFILLLLPISAGVYLIEEGFAIIGAVIIAACLSPFPLLVHRLKWSLTGFDCVKNDKFSILIDSVQALPKKQGVMWHGRSEHDVIDFYNYGRYLPDQTVYDISSVGDEFYVVILHTKKKEVSLAYHTKIYECKELG